MLHLFRELKCCSFLLFMSIVLLLGCGENPTRVERGFYYWKSEAERLVPKEGRCLKELDIDRLYIKFFDVVPDERLGNRPVAKTSLRMRKDSGVLKGMEREQLPSIVPTVFIRNEVLKGIGSSAIDSLADNITHLCEKYYEERFPAYDGRALEELQIDCDWTPTTQEAYFELLKGIKKRSGKRVSVTLRLYPYKYPDKMGIPPADRASLMCYNLFHPLKYQDRNSIQDPRELKRYLKRDAAYPLPLDVVLPVFSRVHWYQNKRFVKTLDIPPASVEGFSERVEPLWYEVRADTVVEDHYLRRGDRLKVEKASEEGLRRMIASLKEELELGKRTTLAFFDLDHKDIARFDHESLHHCYSALSDEPE